MPGDSIYLAKIVSGVIGALSSIGVSTFWKPTQLREKTIFVAGGITALTGAFLAITLTPLVTEKIGLDPSNIDHTLAVSAFLGAVGVPVFLWIAHFFENREGKDIKEIASEFNVLGDKKDD